MSNISNPDLRIMVRASLSWVPHSSSTPQPARVPLDRAETSAEWGTPPVSFNAPPDDWMSITALECSLSLSLSLSLSGDDDSDVLPPLGVVAVSKPDPDMTAMLSRAAENFGLMWNPPPHPDSLKLRVDSLPAMALLQVHQTKALKDLHEGGHDLVIPH